jgi:ribose 5-phosphate isomerase RpiB
MVLVYVWLPTKCGIRAGIGYNTAVAETMMEDDNTNILCLAATTLSENMPWPLLNIDNTKFSNEERHVRRLAKVTEHTGL